MDRRNTETAQVNVRLSAQEMATLVEVAAKENLPRASIVAGKFIREGIKRHRETRNRK